MFTPGSMNVQPQNVGERGFAILILIFGLVVFTAFISSMTAAIGQLKLARGDKGKDLWMLRRFLRQHAIHRDLSFRVLRYVDNAFAQARGKKIPLSKVPVLALLTDQLRREVEYQAKFVCLNCHPLFEHIAVISKVTMFRLVGNALSTRPLARTDILFSSGGAAQFMHLVVSGELRYVKSSDISIDGTETPEVKDDWLCEPVLWTSWSHMGQARAVATSELVSIQAPPFIDVIRMDQQIQTIIARYARKYVMHLGTIGRGRLSDVTPYHATRSHATSLLDNPEATESQVELLIRRERSQSIVLDGGISPRNPGMNGRSAKVQPIEAS